MHSVDFDIVIAGGGLVGASLACALKGSPFKIALIERTKKNLAINLSDARALTLSPPSVQCLKMLSVWEKVEKHAEPIQEVHVSKKNHFGVTRIKASTYQMPALGHVVNADLLNNALTEMLETIPNLTLFRPDEMIEFNLQSDRAEFTLAFHQKHSAKLAVAADGGESYLRKTQGIAQRIIDHAQIAIMVNLSLKQGHFGVAYERFMGEGSIALLPMKAQTVKCVWIIKSEALPDIQGLSDEDFLNKLQSNFGSRLGVFASLGRRTYYPLSSRYAESLYSERMVLLGNAANTLHPIAAQGFNLGLRDAASLAELLMTAKEKGQDIGCIEFLSAYANMRQRDQQMIRHFTECLAMPTVLQGLGILASEWVAPFKRGIALGGLGKLNPLPKLCRGVHLSTFSVEGCQ